MKTPRYGWVIVALGALMTGATVGPQALAMNKCVGANGKTSYQEQPCASGTKAQVIKGAASTAPGAPPPAAGAGPYGAGLAQATLVYYPVDGRDLESMRAQLKARGPQGHAGYTGVKLSYKFTSNASAAGCTVERVETTLDITMTLPRWTPPPGTAALEPPWNRFIAALRAHEDGHVERGRRFESALKGALSGLSAASCLELDVAARNQYARLAKEHDAAQLEYDRETDHGRSQGAVL